MTKEKQQIIEEYYQRMNKTYEKIATLLEKLEEKENNKQCQKKK